MKESHIIKIIVGLCMALTLVGLVLVFQQGWAGNWFKIGANILKSIPQNSRDISLLKVAPQVAGFDREKTYLLLFQNNWELRPTGGFLGNFGILKIKNGQPTFFETYDTGIFDINSRAFAAKTEPPQPLKDYLKIINWEMRDGNWSPDFPTAAQRLESFYRLEGGQENIDGVIAINAAVLPKLLGLTGSIYLKDFDKEFKADDALYELEYEVEVGYVKRGIAYRDRKKIFNALVKEVIGRLPSQNPKDLFFEQLDKKNILLFFEDDRIQTVVSGLGWAGQINQDYFGDYLMLVEANLGVNKSNAFVTRNVEYSVDLNGQRPQVILRITYQHQGQNKDWFDGDYKAYLRIYAPKGSWFLEAKGVEDKTLFMDELNKTVFGNWIIVPIGQEKVVEFKYLLPEKIADYRILIQKQPGVDNLPIKIILKDINQKEYQKEEVIQNDLEGAIIL